MKITTLLLALLVTGCAGTYNAAPQNYRIKGEDNALSITGKLDRNTNLLGDNYKVTVLFNNNPQIELKLDGDGSGEGTGLPYKEKQTSTSCNGKLLSEITREIKCMVFIDNERTVTLTF